MSGPAYKKHDGAHGTWMDIEWTNQHACGGNEGDNPQVIYKIVDKQILLDSYEYN